MVEITCFPVRSNIAGTLGGNHSDNENDDAMGATNDNGDDEENIDKVNEEATVN